MGNKGKKYIENVVICVVSVWDQYTANYSIRLEFVIRSHHLWFCFGTFLYVIYLSTHVVNRHLFTIASNNVLLLACKPNLSFSFSRLKTVMINLHILNIMYCRLSIYNMTNCISCFNTHPVSSKFTIWQFRGGGWPPMLNVQQYKNNAYIPVLLDDLSLQRRFRTARQDRW